MWLGRLSQLYQKRVRPDGKEVDYLRYGSRSSNIDTVALIKRRNQSTTNERDINHSEVKPPIGSGTMLYRTTAYDAVQARLAKSITHKVARNTLRKDS